MKKLVVLLFLFLFISGCSSKINETKKVEHVKKNVVEVTFSYYAMMHTRRNERYFVVDSFKTIDTTTILYGNKFFDSMVVSSKPLCVEYSTIDVIKE